MANNLKDKGDWSLRANGDTYDDNDTISAKLTKRLKNSSSSVIGIAGQRGVGKSSLAQRVLDNCESEGSFTLLIHSPTRYDPQDYLATLYLEVCREVINRINSELGQTNSLFERGMEELRRLSRFQSFLSFSFLAFPTVIAFAISFVLILYLEIFSPPQNLIPVLVVIIVIFVLVSFLFIFSKLAIPLRLKQHRKAQMSPERTGLLRNALEFSEHLRFQTTLSKSSEVGLSASKINAKSGRGKNLATRPLTLPSLATQFTQFLNEIGEVYSRGPVVICLDELDKIEDPKDLDNLLRGIKGILGESGTHFLLTVSEDALTNFNEQRQTKRGILESAFEDIILLDRINLRLTNQIVDPMYCKSDREKTEGLSKTSTELLWLFGNAIPREIKRNALVCFEKDSPPKTSPPEDIWLLLMNARIDDMKFWAVHAGGENRIRHRFFKCLGESTRILNGINGGAHYDLKLVSEIVTPWVQLFDQIFTVDQDFSEGENVSLDFGGAIIEILLGASALVYVVSDSRKKLSDSSIETQLNEIFRFLSTSPQFTWDIMKEYLAEIDIINNSYPS